MSNDETTPEVTENENEETTEETAPEETTLERYYRFDIAIPVPEKAKAMKLGRYAHLAFRNLEDVTVCVTIPNTAQNIVAPEKRRHHKGTLEIELDDNVSDEEVVVELTHEGLAAMDLLRVEYEREEPGRLLVRIMLPPPVAIVRKRINLPRNTMGEYCSQAAVYLMVNNVVGVREPPHGGGNRQNQRRGRYGSKERSNKINWHVHLMNDYWFNYWVNRKENPDEMENVEELYGPFFWPQECQLCVHVDKTMRVKSTALVRNEDDVLSPNHELMIGAHRNQMQSVDHDRFFNFIIPEYVPCVDGGGQRHLFMDRFADLVAALNNSKISAMLKGDNFLAKTEVTSPFYCCQGKNDPNSGDVYVSAVCFGKTEPIYEVAWEDGHRYVVMERDGKTQKLNKKKGHMVLMSDVTAHQAEGALYAKCANLGSDGMDAFYEESGLIIPEEAFKGDDAEAKRRNNRQRRAQEDQKSAQSTPPKDEAKTAEPEKDDDFGDFGNDLPPEPEPETEVKAKAPDTIPDTSGDGAGSDEEPEVEKADTESESESSDDDDESTTFPHG